MKLCLLVLVLVCSVGVACRVRVPPPPPALPNAFVDVQPGWRLRVITPLLAGGGYQVKSGQTQAGNTITLSTGKDFLGFETAYYNVLAGIKVRFASAELSRDGVRTPQAKPIHPLFAMPRGTRLMRLVFLERGSSTSHDMAVVTAGSQPDLDALTVRARNSDCARHCEWVPAGIAVRPEMQRAGQWVPAR